MSHFFAFHRLPACGCKSSKNWNAEQRCAALFSIFEVHDVFEEVVVVVQEVLVVSVKIVVVGVVILDVLVKSRIHFDFGPVLENIFQGFNAGKVYAGLNAEGELGVLQLEKPRVESQSRQITRRHTHRYQLRYHTGDGCQRMS